VIGKKKPIATSFQDQSEDWIIVLLLERAGGGIQEKKGVGGRSRRGGKRDFQFGGKLKIMQHCAIFHDQKSDRGGSQQNRAGTGIKG